MVLAATTMKLVEQGKLDLSKPITTYAPYTLSNNDDSSKISLQNLLTHTSGVPDLTCDTTCAIGAGQEGAWFAANGNDSLLAPPGAVWNYSNRNFGILGWAIENVTGAPYEQAAMADVFGPAGMTTATFDPAIAMNSDHAVGHVIGSKGTEYYEPTNHDCAVTRPFDGVIASAIDYAHLGEAILADGGNMLTPQSITAMETGYADTDAYPNGLEKYGFGLFVNDWYKGQHVVEHDGDDDGYRTQIWMVPSSDFAVVLFMNRKPTKDLNEIPEKAIDLFLGLSDVPKGSFTTAPSTWEKYVGRYFDPATLGQIDISFDGAALRITAPAFGVSDFPLTQVDGDRFSVTLNGESQDLVFYPGSDGSPSSWIVNREGVGARQ
jgi:CubicO group peptidase (beta-lactamase class C family)